jgi:hypothetical protein
MERVLLDVPPKPQKRFLIFDDLIKKSRLPPEFPTAGGPDTAGAASLEMSDGFSQKSRTSGQTRRFETQDSMDVVGHHDPSIKIYVRTTTRHLRPFFSDDDAEIRRNIFPSMTSPNQQTRPRVQMVTQ